MLGEVQVEHQEEFPHGKDLDGAVQGDVGVPIPRGVQGRPGCGTECSGLGDKVRIWAQVGLDGLGYLFQSELTESQKHYTEWESSHNDH